VVFRSGDFTGPAITARRFLATMLLGASGRSGDRGDRAI
jgi:hypothetical protein